MRGARDMQRKIESCGFRVRARETALLSEGGHHCFFVETSSNTAYRYRQVPSPSLLSPVNTTLTPPWWFLETPPQPTETSFKG